MTHGCEVYTGLRRCAIVHRPKAGYIGIFIGTDNDNKIHFITDLGRRLTTVSGDPLESIYTSVPTPVHMQCYAHNFLTPSRFEAFFIVNLGYSTPWHNF